ncbi:hypothetical protein DXG03_004423 [Asterophora parasitica]|uniref:ABC transporter domain-containing protein n=1 Tax=Asterophora parasitica TaxID=117018 RepID=A0A9P7G2D7_9AGAR|nr:hypothetical protein DXG03_004423 [Asterophora parasitica]
MGVWQFWTFKQSRFDPQANLDEFVSGLKLFRRLVLDISSFAPKMLILFILSKLWEGVESALLMHLSSQLLRIMELGVREGKVDTWAIYTAVASCLLCSAFFAVLNWWTSHTIPAFRSRIMQYYEIHLMQARLRLDLSSAQDPDNNVNISAYDAWTAFEAIVAFFGQILTSVSQLILIVHISRSNGGLLFAVLCIAKPFLRIFFTKSVWSKMFLVSKNNEDSLRMERLAALTSDYYRQDYIAGNLGSHILSEYKHAQERLGDTCTDEFWEQFERRDTPVFDVVSSLAGDLPMIYCAVNVIANPSTFSVASIAVLQASSATLRYSLQVISQQGRSFQRHVSKLKNLYAVAERESKLKDGELPYPAAKSESVDGMAFTLQDVTFSYPGSKSKSPALKHISLSIKPGALVVIVGANGSGKSTIIKLLTRLYDVTSGTILVDSVPVQEFRSSDLRQAMATFTQDHHIYPLSLYENIALGNPAVASDAALVENAAQQGGAAEFMGKLADGMKTMLEPRNSAYPMNIPNDPEHPLRKQMNKLSKKIEISGGEKQRLVASRTFMHLSSGKVKFVAVDEPSSALDPEGEFQLFERLVTGRAGKTMVCVTHRFGHLTKHADLIVCMKDGMVAESGSHGELMKLEGEYAKLYQIQADAFSATESS